MKRFSNILYVADGVTGACASLERAVGLARANDARLTVIDVLEEVESPPAVEQRLGMNLNRILQDRRRESLESVVAAPALADELIYCDVLTGVPFVEIIRVVLGRGHDLVIKEARPPRGLSERLFGSTDLHLLRKCPCPVWIDRADAERPYGTVLAAVDPVSEKNRGNDRLVMNLASSLAQREGAKLAVVHAWELYGEPVLRDGRLRLSDTEFEQLLSATRQRHRDALDRLLAEYGLSTQDDNVYLVRGDAAACIRDTIATAAADLVVLATVGRGGIPGFFIGNTAEEVIQTMDASVLAVKPEDFISPVRPRQKPAPDAGRRGPSTNE